MFLDALYVINYIIGSLFCHTILQSSCTTIFNKSTEVCDKLKNEYESFFPLLAYCPATQIAFGVVDGLTLTDRRMQHSVLTTAAAALSNCE